MRREAIFHPLPWFYVLTQFFLVSVKVVIAFSMTLHLLVVSKLILKVAGTAGTCWVHQLVPGVTQGRLL